VKRLVPLLACIALAASLSTGAAAQQKVFMTMKAAPSIPPTHSPQPIPGNVYINACGGKKSKNCKGRPTAKPSAKPGTKKPAPGKAAPRRSPGP